VCVCVCVCACVCVCVCVCMCVCILYLPNLLTGGIDSEKDYGYIGTDGNPCWTNAAKRHVATMNNQTNVPVNDEA